MISGLDRPATLDDIAAEVGVCKMAVSVVLNGGRSTAKVSATTRKRIEAVAERLNYRPNIAARSLISKRTSIVGLIGHHALMEDTPKFSQMMAGLQIGCAEAGLDLLLCGTSSCDSLMSDYRDERLMNGMIDGLLIASPISDAMIAQLQKAHFRMLALCNQPGIPTIKIENEQALRSLIRHLWCCGHRRIVCRPPLRVDPIKEPRLLAILDECNRLNMHVVISEYIPRHLYGLSVQEEFLFALHRSDRASAIIVHGDQSVNSISHICASWGWRIPEDLAIAAYDSDGHLQPTSQHMQITAVRSNVAEMACASVGILARMIKGEEISGDIPLPVIFKPGETA